MANGVRLVWLIYPEKHLVVVRTPDSEDILTENDTLDGGDMLPDFKLPVRDIFTKGNQLANLVRNRRLSKSILDSGWGLFQQLLTDKAARAGRFCPRSGY